MKNKNAKIEKYDRKSLFTSLKGFCIHTLNNPSSYIEITEWHNGEGFDIDIQNGENKRFQLTWGEYDALKHLIKNLYKE